MAGYGAQGPLFAANRDPLPSARTARCPVKEGLSGAHPLLGCGFQREEAAALKAVDGQAPFRQVRDLVGRVQAGCAIEVIEVDGNSYSVPWRLIGESVRVVGKPPAEAVTGEDYAAMA
jgi:hypothetical protein